MKQRYIIVEEKRHEEPQVFIVYKKGWLFDYYVKLFTTKEDAIKYIFSILREDQSYQKVVFDTDKDLKTERTF